MILQSISLYCIRIIEHYYILNNIDRLSYVKCELLDTLCQSFNAMDIGNYLLYVILYGYFASLLIYLKI